MIGKLLGHTQVQTTARYAHLASDPMKAAAARISERLAAAPGWRTLPLVGHMICAMTATAGGCGQLGRHAAHLPTQSNPSSLDGCPDLATTALPSPSPGDGGGILFFAVAIAKTLELELLSRLFLGECLSPPRAQLIPCTGSRELTEALKSRADDHPILSPSTNLATSACKLEDCVSRSADNSIRF